MKITLFVIALLCSHSLMSKEYQESDNTYFNQYVENQKFEDQNKDIEIANLTKTIAFMQRDYEAKINNLQIELTKLQTRLLDKALNEEKIQTALKERFDIESAALKKELAYKTKLNFELQRQLEKINLNEDTKNLIKMNTDLAANLRKTESALAFYEASNKSQNIVNQNVKPLKDKSLRKPASTEDK